MSRSKKIFLILVAIFFAIMIYISYDISSRTTFPGSKPQLKERLMNTQDEEKSEDVTTASDSVEADTIQ